MVNVRKAIESTYSGKCTVICQQPYERDNGSTGFEPCNIYEKIPCRLSYKNAPASDNTSTGSPLSQVIKLFVAPELEIKPGAKLVITQSGKTQEFSRSGEPTVYDTHQEIMLELFRGWT